MNIPPKPTEDASSSGEGRDGFLLGNLEGSHSLILGATHSDSILYVSELSAHSLGALRVRQVRYPPPPPGASQRPIGDTDTPQAKDSSGVQRSGLVFRGHIERGLGSEKVFQHVRVARLAELRSCS